MRIAAAPVLLWVVGSLYSVAEPNLYFYRDAASFSAEGTWIPADEKSHAADETETRLDCEKSTRQCIEATADHFAGHPHIAISYFQIVKWNDNGITVSNDDSVCVTRTLSIGFASKHISDTREFKVLPDSKRKACEDLKIPSNEVWTMALKNSKEWTAERDREHKF